MNIAVIIAGCRDFSDYEKLKAAADSIIPSEPNNDITIISGHANGADALGERYAREHKYNLELFPANWSLYGKAAGPIRNAKMANRANEFDKGVLVAFWDGRSRGTKSMIDIAIEIGLEVHVIRI